MIGDGRMGDVEGERRSDSRECYYDVDGEE
jgi:hypothetical protein